MSRVYNFSAGPAVLPEEVLKEAAAEMLDYKGTGMSVMEIVVMEILAVKMLAIGIPAVTIQEIVTLVTVM